MCCEQVAIFQLASAGAKVVRGMYLMISAEKKAEIGQCIAEHSARSGSALHYEASSTYMYH